MVAVWRWIGRGRDPRTTMIGTGVGVTVVLGLVILALTWQQFVFSGFELIIGLAVLAIIGAALAVRSGGSLLMSVWVVFAPVGAITLLVPLVNNDLSVSGSHLLDLIGAMLYVGLGTAVPAGLLVYAVGVRSRTGPWEGSLEDHLPTSPGSVTPIFVAGWAGIVALLTAALSIHLVNLGITWSILLLGGLGLTMLAGTRGRDATEAMALGLVTGAGLGLTTSLGFTANVAGPSVLLAWMFIAAIVAGLPIGALGYLSGRAIKADTMVEGSNTHQPDTVAF